MESTARPGPMYTWWTWKFGMTFTNWVLRFFGRVQCDHCHRFVKGFISRDLTPNEFGGISAGVYVGWTQFTEFGEWIVCDPCMWKNERFLAVYPGQRGVTA